MGNLFENYADLDGYLFRIQDNGGASADRYTVVFSDGDYLALSRDPTAWHGVSQWGEGIDPEAMNEWAETGVAVDLSMGDLPEHIRAHIFGRCNEAWRDFLEAIETREPHAVARSRELAEVNEGIHDSGAKGIYSAGEGYCVRLDGDDAWNDRGPFLTAREALEATLPDESGMAGEEYHSPLWPASMNSTEGVAEEVAAWKLESRSSNMPSAFIYADDLYCADCGDTLTRQGRAPLNPDDESSYDSGDFPKGPYANGGGEADTPQPCGGCGHFLESPLTGDGASYVRREAAPYISPDDDPDVISWGLVADRAEDDGKPALSQWLRFYFQGVPA